MTHVFHTWPRSLANNLLALFVVALVAGALFLLREVLTTPIVALLFLIPVVVSAIRWGLAPGIVASIAAFLSLNYFFIPPFYTLAVHQTQDILALIVFLAVAVIISQLVGRVYTALSAAQARELEAVRLYDFSLALVGLSGETEIADLLALQTGEALQAEVEVWLQAEPEGTPLTVRYPPSARERSDPFLVAQPIDSVRGHLGEVRIWRGEPLEIPESRLVHTLAGQTALALERARLSRIEMRSHILEESDRLKSALLSSMSHELRTPLVTIKAAATGLRSGMVDWNSPARHDLLAALEDEVDRLNQLVDNLLSSSRLEAGALKLDRQWHIPLEIVDSTVDRLARVLQHHVVEINVADDLPLISVDHVLMQQVFSNLLGNCAKYAPPGSTIRIEASASNEDNLWVQISNEGPPVPKENLATIFEPFQRLETVERPGIGLGLSICKGITEAHGGRIWAVNLPDGFAYRLTLPLTAGGMGAPRISSEVDEP